MKANVLNPPKNPTKTDTNSMKPDSAKIAPNNANSFTWLHNGVVGENDSWNKKKSPSRPRFFFSIPTYVFEAVLAELRQQMQKAQKGEPRAPQQHLVDVLDVNYAENEDELVKDEIPKFVFEVLLFGDSEFAEHQLLDRRADQDQPAEGHVDHGLERWEKIVRSCSWNEGAVGRLRKWC